MFEVLDVKVQVDGEKQRLLDTLEKLCRSRCQRKSHTLLIKYITQPVMVYIKKINRKFQSNTQTLDGVVLK